MRISDWSSDVCSSDLQRREVLGGGEGLEISVERHARDGTGMAPLTASTAGGRGRSTLGAAAPRGVHSVDVVEDRRRQGIDHQADDGMAHPGRSEEHTSELQSLMRHSYAVFCLKKKNTTN